MEVMALIATAMTRVPCTLAVSAQLVGRRLCAPR